MHYNLSYLKESLRTEIESQPGERLLGGHPVVDRYQSAHILPCYREDPLVYNYGGGVVTAEGNFVSGTGLHELPCVVGGAYPAECTKVRETVIYIGFLLPEWGNTITDSIKKLWYLQTDEGKALLQQGVQIVYVTFENQPLKKYQLELFRLAGFDATQWHQILQPTEFTEVIVPGNSLVTDPQDIRFYYPEFAATVQSIKSAALLRNTAPALEKVYLTRTHWSRKNDSNERLIERLFADSGFQVIAPEQLSVSEQIRLMAQARVVAATEGSVAHNALFMTAGCELIVLQKADYVNNYQLLINAVAQLRVTYLPAHHSTCTSKEMPWAGPFYLTVTPELKAWCGREIRVPAVWRQPSYWKYRFLNAPLLRRMKLKLYLVYTALRSRR